MKDKNKKEGFFKRAFRNMIESAYEQHEVDKANFEAVKAESKARLEENRGTNTLKRAKENAKENWDYAHLSISEKRAIQKERQQKEIEDAIARTALANERIEKARQERAEEKAKKDAKKNN